MIRYAVTMALLLATPAVAQDAQTRPSITVTGRGKVETPPDTFRINAEIEGRGANQVAALRALATVQTRVEDIKALEGLERARLTTGSPSVSPTFDPACEKDDYGDTNDCPITGYVASSSLTLEAGPVARAGDAVSLASERGARSANVASFYLADDTAQTAEAQRAAFADARRQAETLATAAGQRVVRVLKLQNPGDRNIAREMYGFVDDIVVTGSLARPTISLTVAPPPVRTEAQIQATFEIE